MLKSLIRPNIYNLESYRCARDDFSEGILLDANENTHGVAVNDLNADEHSLTLNRYPDPHQVELKTKIANFRDPTLSYKNLYLGVGSDEAIDSLIRCVCTPAKENILICPPTYGMYSVCANINDVGIIKVPLTSSFDLDLPELLKTLKENRSIKLVYICSPGNPTGKLISQQQIAELLNNYQSGLVVVDEAYIDFTEGSCAPLVNKFENLAVLQTLSKSFGLAGLRLGMCFACPELARVLNAMKAPYNISSATSQVGLRALEPKSIELMRKFVAEIKSERARMALELPKIEGVGRILGGLDANFILVEILENGVPSNSLAHHVYHEMATNRKIVVRFRGNELNCTGGLRISIGTKEENDRVLKELKSILSK